MQYFEITEQSEGSPRWQLRILETPSGEEFEWGSLGANCAPLEFGGPLTAAVWDKYPGVRVRFTFATTGSVPILDEELALEIARSCPDDVQLVPVRVQNSAGGLVPGKYHALNAYRAVNCIDFERSIVQLWTREHALEDDEPEKEGRIHWVANLHVDPTRVGRHKIFRPMGWEGALVCDEDIANLLKRHDATHGITLIPAS